MNKTTGRGVLQQVEHLVAALLAVVMAPLRFVRWLREWLRWWTKSGRRSIMLTVLFAIFVLGVLETRVARLDLRYGKAAHANAVVAETFYVPPPFALTLFGLGHQNLVADMLFMRANMYFVNHLFGDRIFHWLDIYVEAILAMDPYNPRVYEWASQACKFGQTITNEVLEKSNGYAQKGIEHFPDHWRFYFDIGFNYHMEWKPDSDEEKEEMRLKALTYFSIASSLPGSKLDPNFVAELHLQRNDIQMALFHSYQRYWEASERERGDLRKRIARYESEAAANRLKDIETRWQSDYPYMEIGLFELLGPKYQPSVPDTWAAMNSYETKQRTEDEQ